MVTPRVGNLLVYTC